MDAQELQGLADTVQYLSDRQKILDCVNGYARAVDRHDVDLIQAVFHPDGVDEHGVTVQQRESFAEWANDRHSLLTRMHTHNVTTHTCTIEGNVAHAETYVLFGLAHKNETTAMLGSGRYIDRLEKRDGDWRVVLRRVIVDWTITGDATHFHSQEYQSKGYPLGRWDRQDLSYARPLTLDEAGKERLRQAGEVRPK